MFTFSATNKEVEIVLSFDSSKVCKSLLNALLKKGCGPDIAEPFYISFNAYDNGHKIKLGYADGVYHKNLKSFVFDQSFNNVKKFVYLNMLFIEEEYRNHGIASKFLETLPELFKCEIGASIDAVMLSPAPHIKNSDGKIIEIPTDSEFFIKLRELIVFYKKRNFNFTQTYFSMIRKQW